MLRLWGSAAAALGVAALIALPALPASAHDYLIGSTPASGAHVTTSIGQVTLDYNDIVQDLEGRGALVEVTNAAGRHFETGCATVQDTAVSVPVALGAAGTYTVNWRVVSADGHPVASAPGTAWLPVVFSYTPPQGAKVSNGMATGLAKCGFATSGPSSTQAAAAASTPRSSGDGLVITIVAIAGGVVVLAVVGVLAVLLVSRRRPPE